MSKKILNIYIATYNRREIIYKKVNDLLSLKNNEFDVWVLDDSSTDGTYDKLKRINDSRLHLLQNNMRIGNGINGAMPNWLKLASECDGIYSFHLNDRDEIYVEKIPILIEFLKKNPHMACGICNSKEIKIFKKLETKILLFPYNAIHPTGVIFNNVYFNELPDIKKIYTKERAYIHPHDLILSRLILKGDAFFYEKIWQLPDSKSFSQNKSFLYQKGNAVNSWFSPQERYKEYLLFIKDLNSIDVSKKIKRKKAYLISIRYLYYSTFNFQYYVTDEGQINHYGINRWNISIFDLIKIKASFVKEARQDLQEEGILSQPFIFSLLLEITFLALCLVIPIKRILCRIK